MLDRLTVLVKRSGGHSETEALNQGDAVKAQGQKAGSQKITNGGQIWNGEVVRIHTRPPHQTDNKVGNIKENGDLGEEDKVMLSFPNIGLFTKI